LAGPFWWGGSTPRPSAKWARLGDNVVAAIIGVQTPRAERLSAVRHVSWVSWKTDDIAGQLQFDEIAGRLPDRRFTAPYDDHWSHHAEWYCRSRTEAEAIGERIRKHGGARVRVHAEATEETDSLHADRQGFGEAVEWLR
jgi:hypothetical protein